MELLIFICCVLRWALKSATDAPSLVHVGARRPRRKTAQHARAAAPPARPSRANGFAQDSGTSRPSGAVRGGSGAAPPRGTRRQRHLGRAESLTESARVHESFFCLRQRSYESHLFFLTPCGRRIERDKIGVASTMHSVTKRIVHNVDA